MKGKKGFQRGQSGNPGGRPKENKSLVEECRAFVALHGLPALKAIARDGADRKLQLAALIYITNRGFGCPTDKLSVDGKISLEQLLDGSWDKKSQGTNTPEDK